MKQFFQLKSSFYFLKNVVFALFCFVLGYLLGSGVIKAEAADKMVVFSENLVTKDGYEFQSKLDELVDALDNTGLYYALSIVDDTTYGYYIKDLYIYDYLPTKFGYENVYGIASLKENGKVYRLIGNFNYKTGVLSEKNLDYLIQRVNEKKYLDTFNTDSWHSLINGRMMVYASNFDIVNVSDHTYFVNGVSVPKNNKFKPISTIVKSKYTENLRISSSNIDHIEYTFDFGNNNSPIHEFNFSTTWYSNVARLDLFNPPWLEYKKNDISYKLPLDLKRQATLDDVVYYDTQINQIMNIQELKFVVDFNNINQLNEGANSSVFIHFDSSLNFTRKIVYVGEEGSSSNYMTEVDFSNKYGVFVIPKVIQNGFESEVYSPLLYSGKELKINVYDTIDTSVDPVKSYSDYNNLGKAWGNFNYLFRFNNKNQVVFFTNPKYLMDRDPTKIRYDTRYFVHSVCLSPESCEPVVNPNTGEEVNLIPPKNTGDGDDLDTIDKIYDNMDNFIESSKEKSDYFNRLFDNFFKNMPNWVQSLCIFVFIMLQVFVILKIGGFGHGSD